jgi:hypothetical protein
MVSRNGLVSIISTPSIQGQFKLNMEECGNTRVEILT